MNKVPRPRKGVLEINQAKGAYDVETYSIKMKPYYYKVYPFPNIFGVVVENRLISGNAVTYPGNGSDNAITVVFKSYEPSLNHIAHEVSHVLDCISEWIGDEIKGECRAYTTGYIVDCIEDALKRLRK